jgi:hypothetical protein
MHSETGIAGVAITTPAGKVLTKAKSVTGFTGSVLLIVKVKVVILPGPMVLGAKLAVNEGCAQV